jgi:hypothetical protein
MLLLLLLLLGCTLGSELRPLQPCQPSSAIFNSCLIRCHFKYLLVKLGIR